MDWDLVVRGLIHYQVDDKNWMVATMEAASKHIGYKIYTRLGEMLDTDRQKLMMWLDSSSLASTLVGWLFENFVHEQFLKGGTFSIETPRRRRIEYTRHRHNDQTDARRTHRTIKTSPDTKYI